MKQLLRYTAKTIREPGYVFTVVSFFLSLLSLVFFYEMTSWMNARHHLSGAYWSYKLSFYVPLGFFIMFACCFEMYAFHSVFVNDDWRNGTWRTRTAFVLVYAAWALSLPVALYFAVLAL